MPEKAEQLHFVTGRLAEHALRQTLDQLAPHAGFTFTLDVLPITVAALMTPQWVERRLAGTGGGEASGCRGLLACPFGVGGGKKAK